MLKGSNLHLPRHITVRTPPLEKTEWLTNGLPFDAIEGLLCIGTPGSGPSVLASPNGPGGPHIIDSDLTIRDRTPTMDQNRNYSMGAAHMQERDNPVYMGTMVDTTSKRGNPKILDITALKSVLPQSLAEEALLCPSVDLPIARDLAVPGYRQLLFSLANGFAGIEDADIKTIICYLQKSTGQGIIQLMCSNAGYSSRAIAQSLFKGAIELGNAGLIDLLLTEKSLGIDVNRLWCCVEGNKYTPIERASRLRHKEVIDVLLKHNSDVNRTSPNLLEFKGALDCAIGSYGDSRVDPQIFRKLVSAGSNVSENTLGRLIGLRDGEFAGILISANASKNVAKWNERGIFRKAVQFLDDETAMATIFVMLEVGADLNHSCKKDVHVHYRPHHHERFHADSVIDAAALRGSVEMIELLLRSGARTTSKTLTFAIPNGNHSLIRMLLDKGADVNSCYEMRSQFFSIKTTPLAEAIRLQSREAVALLRKCDRFRLNDYDQVLAAIFAASEVGNIRFIEGLVHVIGHRVAKQLGIALSIAIREGQDEAVAVLIDAGADLNIYTSIIGIGPPVKEAIKRHNAGLVHLLLEAGARPDNREETHLEHAVEWGDHSIVKTLIHAGAVVESCDIGGKPLHQAIRRQDQVLVQLLLDAGASIHSEDSDTTNLETALSSGDISMACYLLDRGAYARDTQVLGMAMLKRPDFFEFILEKHRMRYPTFPAKFGRHALLRAVELGDEHAIRIMLERGLDAKLLIDMSFDCSDRESPFGRAIMNSTHDVVQLFLQKGCNPNSIVVESGRYSNACYRLTGFLAAIKTRDASKVKLLHRYGADVNFPAHTRVKRTPLQEAAAAGNIDVVELLIRLGAEVNAPAARRDGATALQFAAIGGYIPVVGLLLSFQADVNAPASKVNGRTALEGAAEHGRLDMLKLLLDAGAGNGGKDKEQFIRAKDLARDQGFNYIVDFLDDFLYQRGQEHEPVMLADGAGDDLGTWEPDGWTDFINWDWNGDASSSNFQRENNVVGC